MGEGPSVRGTGRVQCVLSTTTEEQNMQGRCQQCKFWDDWVCTAFDAYTKPSVDGAAIWASASDDSGLVAEFRTGPEFGCMKFTARNPRSR